MDVDYSAATTEEEREPPCCLGEAAHVLSSGTGNDDNIRKLQQGASIEGASEDPEPARRLPGVLPWGSTGESVIQIGVGELDNTCNNSPIKSTAVDYLTYEEGVHLHSEKNRQKSRLRGEICPLSVLGRKWLAHSPSSSMICLKTLQRSTMKD